MDNFFDALSLFLEELPRSGPQRAEGTAQGTAEGTEGTEDTEDIECIERIECIEYTGWLVGCLLA